MRETLKKTLSLIATAIATTVVGTSLGVASAQPRRATTSMAAADILRVASVSDAQISPNGQWVVYTVSTVAGDETVSTLWLARLNATTANPSTSTSPPTSQRLPTTDWPDQRSAPTPLLADGWNASNPRWSPDSSKIAFLATQDDQHGLWVVNLDKREPRLIASPQNTNFFITYAGEALAWAPDSKRIAYISATEESPHNDLVQETQATASDDPRVIDRIQYKSRTSFSDNRRTHVWITAIDKPEPRQLTSGPYYDHAITFSPSGDEIAFLSNHEADPDANNNSDIFAVDMHAEVRQITATRGCEHEPAWSPDGTWIAYTATKRDVTTIDSVAEDTHVWVTNAAGSSARELTAELDRRARSPRWSATNKTIYFLAGDRGSTYLHAIGLSNSGRIAWRVLFPSPSTGSAESFTTRPFQINSFSIGARLETVERGTDYTYDGAPVAFALGDAVHPSEIWVAKSVEGLRTFAMRIQRLTSHNDALTRSRSIVEPEEIKFKSFDGTPIQGWLMKPVGWRENRKYPLILSIHGGPHGMSGYAFNPTFQVYAARGYAVLYLNPRGSSGYGQKFSDGTLNEWGGGDYKDLMSGVDEALRKFPWIDGDRMGVTGGSYGGFMTNWIITQTPRFRAAVSVASLSNLISFYSTSLYQDLIHAEFGGFPWDNYDLLWQWSPLRYVKQAQTPTLFIHGEQDNDVHITQAEEMYTALKRRGVETVLVRYPREGHGLREPKHRVDALERTLAWFDRYLK
jgi:dipeptidyl aminopeptidase/acylaminoacyl peptidase